ncbi:probable nuclear transport factor 2 isoform X1 [Neocloeon triangulifer]|uniref:probable nuclear transport factor 2 isoform X1 n=1 Tax=Neocloeon triangulifer TaxID=2078957 RepID=UPI00286F8543|nr:probable nuclear transport factor 2 isoform X1 [Neocloeon triangulifer]
MNPNFEEIGREFVKQYYSLFDNQDTRLGMAVFYNAESSLLTFEGKQLQGALNIIEKFSTLGFKNINRVITTVDSQPMLDGGVLISVLGRLQCDEDPPHEFTQIFILQAIQGSFVLMHDIFRLGLHDLP